MSSGAGSAAWRPKGIVAVLDTSTLVRAWLSREDNPSPARDVMRLAGQAYDSFTGPAILNEVEEVLVRPRFGATRGQVRLWLDAFLRLNRQVFPEVIPRGDPAAIGGDVKDLAVLNTAYAAAAGGEEVGEVLASARLDGGWFILSENSGYSRGRRAAGSIPRRAAQPKYRGNGRCLPQKYCLLGHVSARRSLYDAAGDLSSGEGMDSDRTISGPTPGSGGCAVA